MSWPSAFASGVKSLIALCASDSFKGALAPELPPPPFDDDVEEEVDEEDCRRGKRRVKKSRPSASRPK